MVLCINRNIVECKGYHRKKMAYFAYLVLIETLWNVKMICGAAMVFHLFVLIETLWNVKVDIAINHDPDAILY